MKTFIHVTNFPSPFGRGVGGEGEKLNRVTKWGC